MKKNEDTLSFSDKCAEFLSKNRKALAFVFAAVCIVIAVVMVTTALHTYKLQKGSEITEALITDWLNIHSKKPEDLISQEDALLAKLEEQAHKNEKSYIGYRAYTVLGEAFVQRKDWEKALNFYRSAGDTLPQMYTAGIAYFNAAACADELQKNETALELYTLSASCEDFPLKPRALFNIGRVEEALMHKDKAIEAYTKLTEQYPNNNWSLLGKSRIIALSIQ
ncbi:MAG: tetratricopeptide repeat protein [Treponema sp.]